MANSTDETGKGTPRPADAGAGKRTYATLDLQATEIADKSGEDARSKAEAAADHTEKSGADASTSFVTRARTAAGRVVGLAASIIPASPFLSHMGAGVLGALIVALIAYLLMPVQSIDPRLAIDLHRLATRLSDAETVLGMRSGDSSGLVARTEELSRSVRALGEAQSQLASDAKALEAKIGGGQAVPQDLAERIARLERALTTQPGGESSESAKSVVAAFDRELAGVRTEAARLSQRMDTLKGEVEDRLRSAVKSADLAAVQARLAWLDKELQAFLKSEGERSANAGRALLSLELAALRRIMDRGEPFATELASVKAAAGDTLDLKPLERYMREGVPPAAEIAKSFRKVANAMLDAEAEPADSSLVDRLLSGARSIVRVRKSGHSPDDTSLEATLARVDAALKEGRLAEVLEQGKKLPPKAALAGEEWLKLVEARRSVDLAMADIEASLKAAFAGKPLGTEQRR